MARSAYFGGGTRAIFGVPGHKSSARSKLVETSALPNRIGAVVCVCREDTRTSRCMRRTSLDSRILSRRTTRGPPASNGQVPQRPRWVCCSALMEEMKHKAQKSRRESDLKTKEEMTKEAVEEMEEMIMHLERERPRGALRFALATDPSEGDCAARALAWLWSANRSWTSLGRPDCRCLPQR